MVVQSVVDLWSVCVKGMGLFSFLYISFRFLQIMQDARKRFQCNFLNNFLEHILVLDGDMEILDMQRQ